jgi:hypothetical protein
MRKLVVCKICNKERENATGGICDTCRKAQQRAAERDPDARREQDASKALAHIHKAQKKIRTAVYKLREILEDFKEYGEASHFLSDQSFVSMLSCYLDPLLDKVKTTNIDADLRDLDPMKDTPNHIKHVGINSYVEPPFTGKHSQPEGNKKLAAKKVKKAA